MDGAEEALPGLEKASLWGRRPRGIEGGKRVATEKEESSLGSAWGKRKHPTGNPSVGVPDSDRGTPSSIGNFMQPHW